MIRIVLVFLVVWLLAGSASSATFTLDDGRTLPDAIPGDGACLTASATCTLTAAIMESEALPGPDTIEWAVLEPTISGAHVIADDLTLRGTLGPRGDNASLTVISGGRLLAEGITASDLALTADGGEIDLQSVSLSTSNLRILAGGTLQADHLSAGLGSGSMWTAIRVEGGRALLSHADLEGTQSPLEIRVTGGELVLTDSCLRLDEASRSSVLEVTDGNVRLERCTVSGGGFRTWHGMGRIEVIGGTLELEGCEIEGSLSTSALVVHTSATLRISCTRIQDNRGGAISSAGDVYITDSVIERHRYETYLVTPRLFLHWYGFGIAVHGGRMHVLRTLIDDNDDVGLDVRGGEVMVENSVIRGNVRGINLGGGLLRVRGSVVEANTQMWQGGSGLNVTAGTAEVVDTTFFTNRASTNGGNQGAISVTGGEALLLSSVIARGFGGGGVRASSPGILQIADSIVADNAGGDCDGEIESMGYLLVEDASACSITGDLTGVLTGVDAGLVPILDRSSFVATLPLLPASPARDAAHPSGNRDIAGNLFTDARRWPRIVDGDGDSIARGDLGPREECEDSLDSDGDGRGDACDGCPFIADLGRDADVDGMGDACDDGDADGDGVADRLDPFPGLAGRAGLDTDGDGIRDACDFCPLAAQPDGDADDDGLLDGCARVPELSPWSADLDCDALFGACDLCPLDFDPAQADTDGDGVGDACDSCPLLPNGSTDDDLDGVGDACDNCRWNLNPDQANADGDSFGDACDNCPNMNHAWRDDSDRDGVGDVCDNCPDHPNGTQANMDGDSFGDLCDNCIAASNSDQSDVDGDSAGDACDNCPLRATRYQEDFDGDGRGDACDNCIAVRNADQSNGDTDAVGDACDNCPDVANPDQADVNANRVGDACETCAEPWNLRVTRAGGSDLQLAWQLLVASESDVYSGEISALRAGARAETSVACLLPSPNFVSPLPPTDTYFLIGARCGGERSPIAHDSFGTPVTATPPNACP